MNINNYYMWHHYGLLNHVSRPSPIWTDHVQICKCQYLQAKTALNNCGGSDGPDMRTSRIGVIRFEAGGY